MKYGSNCALDKILVNLEFLRIWNKLQGIFIAKWVSKNVQFQLENISFSNTLTFALIVLVSQIDTVVYRVFVQLG